MGTVFVLIPSGRHLHRTDIFTERRFIGGMVTDMLHEQKSFIKM